MKTTKLKFGQIGLALVLAAITGGIAVGLELWAGMMIAALAGGPAAVAQAAIMGLMIGLGGILYAAVAFGIGLVLIGGPAWLALHGLGARRRWAAVLTGAVLATAPAVIFLAVVAGEQDDWGAMPLAAFLILPGAAAGWVLHRIAYGRTPPGASGPAEPGRSRRRAA
jgi:hypothetical protein